VTRENFGQAAPLTIDAENVIGWRRGDDRFVIINKADTPFTADLPGELQTGTYEDVRTGKTLQVQQGGTNQQLLVNPRTALMFVKV
jgi:Alpha amylase, C-terminal all-beta domain